MRQVTVALICVFIAVVSFARDLPAAPGQAARVGAKRIDNGIAPNPNFSDPGNHTAKAVAKFKGISVAEAKKLLRTQQRSGLLVEKLTTQFPDTFLGVRFDGPGKIRALFTGNDTRQDAVLEAARAVGINDSVEVAPAAMSRKNERELTTRLIAELRKAGHNDVDFSIDSEAGVVTVGATEDSGLQDLVQATGGSAVHKVLFDPDLKVVLTTYAIAGDAWNAQYGAHPGCTTGFSVYHQTLAAYGTTTAGHCDANSPAEFNPYMNTGYGDPSGNRLVFRQEWIGNGLDIQFHTLGESGDETGPYYWNGTSSIPIVSSWRSAPEPSTTLCKWGRETRWTCGTVGGPVTSTGYGDGFYTINNPNLTYVTYEGDSGGPVVSGQTAYGWIHGRVLSTGSAVFLTVQQVYAKTPLRLTVCVPGTNC